MHGKAGELQLVEQAREWEGEKTSFTLSQCSYTFVYILNESHRGNSTAKQQKKYRISHKKDFVGAVAMAHGAHTTFIFGTHNMLMHFMVHVANDDRNGNGELCVFGISEFEGRERDQNVSKLKSMTK